MIMITALIAVVFSRGIIVIDNSIRSIAIVIIVIIMSVFVSEQLANLAETVVTILVSVCWILFTSIRNPWKVLPRWCWWWSLLLFSQWLFVNAKDKPHLQTRYSGILCQITWKKHSYLSLPRPGTLIISLHN